MSECPSCKTPCEEGDRFCNQCGGRIETTEDPGGGHTQKALSLSDVQYNLGVVYYKKGELAKALECWEKGLRQTPDNAFLQERIVELKEEIAGAE